MPVQHAPCSRFNRSSTSWRYTSSISTSKSNNSSLLAYDFLYILINFITVFTGAHKSALPHTGAPSFASVYRRMLESGVLISWEREGNHRLLFLHQLVSFPVMTAPPSSHRLPRQISEKSLLLLGQLIGEISVFQSHVAILSHIMKGLYDLATDIDRR